MAPILETMCVKFHPNRPSRLGCRARTHTHMHTHTHIHAHAYLHSRAAGINEIAEPDASVAVYPALLKSGRARVLLTT